MHTRFVFYTLNLSYSRDISRVHYHTINVRDSFSISSIKNMRDEEISLISHIVCRIVIRKRAIYFDFNCLGIFWLL